MRQTSFAEGSFEHDRKPTRREIFLEEMDRVIPWQELCAVIEPFCPKPIGAGRQPIGLERMLRIHFLQNWFNLSDPAMEEALYDSRAMRPFARIDLGEKPAPDETTILKFRHLLEAHNLGREGLEELVRLGHPQPAEAGEEGCPHDQVTSLGNSECHYSHGLQWAG